MSMKWRPFAILLFCSVGLMWPQIFGTLGQSASSADVKRVNYDGHILSYPSTLANQIIISDFREATSDEWGVLQPPRLEIAFSSIDGGRTGAVRFYRVMDTIDYSAHEQIQAVRQLVAERSDLAQETTLPTLYPFLPETSISYATVTFDAQAHYVETAGYNGITFINGRVYDVSSSSSEITGLYRLIFEGISRDENWYVSAYFHLSVTGLPESFDVPAFEDLEPQMLREVFDDLYTDDFTPSLQTLEQVLESLDYQDPS